MNIIKLRGVWYTVSGILIIGSIVSIAVYGLRFGIDFTGGSLLSVRFNERPTSVEIERSLEGIDVGSIVVQPVGDADVNLRMKTLTQEESLQVMNRLTSSFTDVEQLKFDSIGPAVGKELRQKSVKALLISLICILIYIAYAFRKVSVPVQSWKYGVITTISALHDAILPIGLFSVLGIFTRTYEVDVTFVVAILTILGYSINDTIVVLDRIRENLHKMSGSFEHIVWESLKQAAFRSINTTITTLAALVAIFFFGGVTLKPFALALIVGIISGAYSSIFIAAPLLVTFQKLGKKE
jgi:preprotein translocase subunit SecF